MRRLASTPRPHWESKVEAAGLTWHASYWDESAFYALTARDVEALESATNELARMSLDAAQHIIDNRLYARLAIPPNAIPLIERSWEAEPPSLYGRFDLAYDGTTAPRLLEYNADTPTSLLEAAVIQWYWLQEKFPASDQFNSIHERLVDLWRSFPFDHVDFCSTDDPEDGMTVAYLLDTALQAGLTATMFPIDEIGWNGTRFCGPDNRPLGATFKLYPWEWLVREPFAEHIAHDPTLWIEPPWKMLLSNKGIVPILWELYPDHPNLLEAHFDHPHDLTAWVRKPLLGREGSNITLHSPTLTLETPGDYGPEGHVYQSLAPLANYVIGSWVIGHENGSSGIGIRESDSPITTDTSRFVPHLIE